MREIYILIFISLLQFYSPVRCSDQRVDQIGSNDPELEILQEFYYATSGQNWTQQTNWLNDSISKCQWFGIQCSGDNQRVVRIDLPSNNLQGTLPESFANLTSLSHLFMSANGLTGTLPHLIVRMPSLENIDLNSNQFTGTIPEEFGSMIQMQGLYLFGNMISGTIPKSLGLMSRLRWLHLFSNRLTGTIPEELGQLRNLVMLSLARNNLTGTIPESLSQLTNVQQLHLYENQLTGTIPESMFRNLFNLAHFYLFDNQLTGSIPNSINNLFSLQNLYFHSNQLNGTIPNTIAQMNSLRQIYLHYNQLTGSIPTNFNMPLLDAFSVDFNQLTGTIPAGLFQSSNLVWIGLSHNRLYGTIDTTIGTLSNLRTLLLDNNQLSGIIPDSIGFLSRLTVLSAAGNQLSGTIPASTSTLRALEQFNVGRNRLTGTIPAILGDLQQLTIMLLNNNELTGTIPPEIGNALRLTSFAANDNQLTGTIPPELTRARGLQRLYLNNNMLTGTIPDDLYAIALQVINLAHNQLQGTISPKLATSRTIVEYSVGFNRLTGTLPALTSLASLQSINVKSNYLYGCVILPGQFMNERPGLSCSMGDNTFCCSSSPYICSTSDNCARSSSLVVPSGSVVTYDNSTNLSNLVLEQGGVLIMKPSDLVNVQCLTLEGEIQVDVSEFTGDMVSSFNILSTRCGSLESSSFRMTAVGNSLCSVTYNEVSGNSLVAGVSCREPEKSAYPLILGILIPIGVIIIVGGILLAFFLIRRRKRIQDLKSRVEMLTLSSANIDKESSPPEDFTFKLLEDMPIKLSKTNFKFGRRGNLLVVDQMATDSFNIQSLGKSSSKTGSLYDRLLQNRTVVQLRPVNSPKYRLQFDPQVFEIPHNTSTDVNIRLTLTMTTSTKVSFWIELPEENIYTLIEFDAASEPSSWIDVDDVKPEYPAIGEGGFGAVYRAMYKGQIVAYKTLKMQDMEAEFYREFEQEVRMMMNLHHKGVLQFIGASRVPGKLAILTEFMSQGSLQRLLAGPPLDLGLKVKIIKDIAEALEYLHSSRILHRDIKAENVLVVSTSKDAIVNVKLADFGTARSATEQVTSKFTKGVGTPAYMAVEILKNEKYERSADVFSFAVLVWAIITQEQPYNDFKYAWDVADFVIQGKRLPIPEACPPVLRDLISRCWAQNPEERPTMTEVVNKLYELKF